MIRFDKRPLRALSVLAQVHEADHAAAGVADEHVDDISELLREVLNHHLQI